VTNPRRLIVMRHAKAEPFAATDHERRLTDRGRVGAAAAGRYLADVSLVPGHAVVSTAVRAVQTWEAVAEGSGAALEPAVDGAVYNGSPQVVIEALQTVPEDAETVIFVGHNPTAAYVAHTLDDGEGDPVALTRLLQGFPPGALTVFEIEVPWAELGPETGRVVDFFVGDA
jgi:phosphohistidine phosphatase